MNQIEEEDARLVDQSTTVVVESATSRRRRMEIRRFKRVACLSATSRLSSVQQGTFKRTRPVRTSSDCSNCYRGKDVGGDTEMFSNSRHIDASHRPFSFKAADAFGESDFLLKGSGLLRSKSFPQCLRTGRCVLHFRKTTRDRVIMDVEGQATTFVNENQNTLMVENPSSSVSVMRRSSVQTNPGDLNETPLNGVVTNESFVAFKHDTDGSAGQKERDHLPVEDGSNSTPDSSLGKPDPQGQSLSAPAEESAMRVVISNTAAVKGEISAKCPLSGKVLVCGRRREMEDTAVIVPNFTQIPLAETSGGEVPLCDLHFFAIYDGHGGSQASSFCADRLHHALAEELSGSQVMENMVDDSAWKRVMASCFLKMDQEVGGICPNGGCDNISSSANCCMNAVAPENVGTTAVVAVLSPSQIVVANCGDSRAVLSRGGTAIPMSTDHKPERDDETSRIEAAGGRVIYWDGYRVAGLLALSRALGDRYLKEYVISEPDVLCMPRSNDDECLILASDGLWDVISIDTACDVARRCLASARKRRAHKVAEAGENSACAQVAALLVKLAYGRGSKDNISVVVIDLSSKPR